MSAYYQEQGCPECGSQQMRPDGGCVTCLTCGFSPCA